MKLYLEGVHPYLASFTGCSLKAGMRLARLIRKNAADSSNAVLVRRRAIVNECKSAAVGADS